MTELRVQLSPVFPLDNVKEHNRNSYDLVYNCFSSCCNDRCKFSLCRLTDLTKRNINVRCRLCMLVAIAFTFRHVFLAGGVEDGQVQPATIKRNY
jgi:hypothetical protein